MYGKGFRQYRGLMEVEYMQPEIVDVEAPIRDKFEDVFDMIFSVDPNTGFPSSVLGCYLNENTSEEIRHFIETKLLHEQDGVNALPVELVTEFDKLDGDFITSITPNRYESVEEYETRLSEYLKDLESEENFNARIKELRLKFSGDKNDKKE